MIETLQKINKVVPNLTVSQLIELVNIINGPKLTIDNIVLKGLKDIPHNGLITIDTNNNKTTSTGNPFSVSSYL
ncbi:MAG: hypothetical protein PUJ51_25410 [Clostridiales bacterium]|uniref:hypothetical protein n=1 Tax=Terrisporobacter sp. TaxID=1965305 RepID=UPI002A51BF2B|nr:hypothetical protein [Terrisporobacter sp.]MDD7757798.1 hypothetical protein [Clostridiales bacterium]MDY4134487.1 hypothetical protein [Terrisporobacter sp.]